MVLRFTVHETAIIEAPAELAYTVIADYNQHHGNIIPPQFFGGMKVLKGTGIGSGTRIACTFTVLGQSETLLLDVTEHSMPDGGRMIQEIDSKARNITQFIVEHINSTSCRVTLRTDVLRQPGLVAGTIDEFITGRIMSHMYREELKQLNKYVKTLQ